MSESVVNIEIDGTPMQARKGAMIIEVSDSAGISVPRFCYHSKLAVAANCRMCLVEVEKAPKPLPACATPVTEGMKVFTRSVLARRAQKSVMEFLLINHPLDCPICDQGGECELQDVAMGYGTDVSRFQERKRVVKDKDIGPLVATDMTRCIHCTRCVRFGDEIAGMPELGATGRGESMEIGTYIQTAMASELSGNVIDLCPVGALTSKPFRFRARAWEMQERPSLAAHDCLVSNLGVHLRQREPMRVVPGSNEAVNEVWLSDRDRFSYEGLRSDQRLLTPRLREGENWRDVDWETALHAVVDGIRKITSGHGPAAFGALVAPSSSVEEAYLAQRIVRGIGSGSIDHRLRQADLSDQDDASVPSLGITVEELQTVDCVLLVGSNIRKEQPLLNHRVRKAVRRGARVFAVNPVDWDFNYPLAGRLVTPPQHMLATLAGVAAAAGVDAPALAGIVPTHEQQIVAKALTDARRGLVLLGPSVEGHPDGAALRAFGRALAERAGATWGMLPVGGNSVGVALAGALPHRGPGGVPCALKGLDARQILSGGVRGLLTLGFEPEADTLEGASTLPTLENMEFVVSLSAFRSNAAERYATVLLPISPFLETDASYVNIEGRWQSAAGVARPCGESRPAWKVLRVLGSLLELDGFDYMGAEEVRDEVRALIGCESTRLNAGAAPLPSSLESSMNGAELVRVGEPRIYSVDPVVRNSAPLQRTVDALAAELAISPAVASRLALAEGQSVVVRQGALSATTNVSIDARVPDGCLYLQAGTALSASLGVAFGPASIARA